MKKVSVYTITYGRVAQLEEALNCFLRQDYEGPKEMLILNDLPDQTLLFDHPQVRVINSPTRYLSLGTKRNAAIEMCTGDIITALDDDDLILDHHLTTVVEALGEDEYVFPLTGITLVNSNNTIQGVNDGFLVQLTFTKDAWNKIGRFPEGTNYGEDRIFINNMRATCKGSYKKLPATKATYITTWANGICHVQGFGPDEPGKPTSLQRMEDYVKYEIQKGVFPKGEIRLNPQHHRDYNTMIKKYVNS
jgi:glycosyltransferase involved in cell wall biosynthesis